MVYQFKVEEVENSQRLDQFLVTKLQPLKPELSRKKIQDMIDNGLVIQLDSDKKVTSSLKVMVNQVFQVTLPQPKAINLEPQYVDFKVVYEDEHLLIINKPYGITVHPGSGNHDQTLVNGLLHRFAENLSSISGDERPGIVHRLDKDTNGLMIIAKNDLAHKLLSEMMQKHEINRYYKAFIFGVMNPKNGRIVKNIIRSSRNRLKMTTSKIKGRFAATNYKTLAIYGDGFASQIECKLETGRTHQIRAHLESEKHSIIGDQLYNSCRKQAQSQLDQDIVKKINDFARQALQSYKIDFIHPITKKEIFFEIPLADDLQELCQDLKKL